MKLQICILKLNDTEIIYISINNIRFTEIEFKIKKCLGDKIKVYFTMKPINKHFNNIDNETKMKIKIILSKWLKNFKYHYLKWKRDPRVDNRIVTFKINP